jgi:DNA-binding transcriptional ArsR family regulator
MTVDDERDVSDKRPGRAALRRELRQLAREFADEIVRVLDSHGIWSEGARDASDDTRRIRRTMTDLETVMGQIVADLSTRSEPVAIGKIADMLSLSSRQVAHPMAMLVESGQVIRSGERRGARYQIAPRQRRKTKRSGNKPGSARKATTASTRAPASKRKRQGK